MKQESLLSENACRALNYTLSHRDTFLCSVKDFVLGDELYSPRLRPNYTALIFHFI